MPGSHFWIQYDCMPRHWRCVHCERVDFSVNQPDTCDCDVTEDRPWWSGAFWLAVEVFTIIAVIMAVDMAVRWAIR